MNREISEFPFNRQNAEQIKELGKKAVSAQANLIALIKQIGSDNATDGIRLSLELSVVETEVTLTELLEGTFPELVPVDWGFSK